MSLYRCFVSAVSVLFASLLLAGCGGGSSNSGMLITGTLTEEGGVTHSLLVVTRHSAGERIDEVEICALGQCSTTDAEGQWGFEAPESFDGGEVLFTVQGHGIDTSAVVSIGAGASEVEIDFRHVESGEIEAHHVTIDGETEHFEDHGE